MRGAAAWLELPQNPHPTSLREAAFSHSWEKDAPPHLKHPRDQIRDVMTGRRGVEMMGREFHAISGLRG